MLNTNLSRDTSAILKGISICTVLFMHFTFFIEFSDDLYRMATGICDLGMFTFLFLSGYGLYCSREVKGLRGFWDNKVEKIYIPAVLSQCVSLCVYMVVTGTLLDREVILYELILKQFPSASNPPIWYIPYLLVWYILFYVIYYFAGTWEKRTRVILWTATGLFMMYFTPEIYGGLGSEYCLAFPIGVGLAAIRNKPSKILESRSSQILIALLAVTGFYCYSVTDRLEIAVFGVKINFWVYIIYTNAIAFVQMLALIGVVQMIERMKIKKYLIAWGNISFYVYLMHAAFLLLPFQYADTQLEKLLAFIWCAFGWCMMFYVLNRNTKKTAKR